MSGRAKHDARRTNRSRTKGYHPVVNTSSKLVSVVAGASTLLAAAVAVGTFERWSVTSSPSDVTANVAATAQQPVAELPFRKAAVTTMVGVPPTRTIQNAVKRQPSKSGKASTLARQAQAAARTLGAPTRQGVVAGSSAPFAFNLASFNVLGSNHTQPGGDAHGYAPGRVRIQWAAETIRNDALDIVGLSEIQRDQYTALMQNIGGNYASYPGTSLGFPGIPTNVIWRKDKFTQLDASYITIPFVGQKRYMPVVHLQENATGRDFYIINGHNAPNGRQAERDAALKVEISKINELRSQTHVPVFFFGDLNEKVNALCKVTSQTDLWAASPTGNIRNCTGFRGMRLDWLFGSDTTFSNYHQDRSALVKKTTDHAVVYAHAAVS